MIDIFSSEDLIATFCENALLPRSRVKPYSFASFLNNFVNEIKSSIFNVFVEIVKFLIEKFLFIKDLIETVDFKFSNCKNFLP